MDRDNVINRLQDAGILGAGGAGFPAYAKASNQTETIILNCAECEPLLKVHRQLLQKYAYEILNTLSMLTDIMNAKEVYIAVKSSYKETVKAVQSVLPSFSGIYLKLLPEIYPAGDEVILIYETTGKVIPAGSLPIHSGVTVFNVETIYNSYLAIKHSIPVTHKYITIAGEVEHPITVRVPVGMEIKEAVKLAGSSKISDAVYIMGGPMTGSIAEDTDPILKTTNAVLVLPRTHFIIRKRLENSSIQMKRAMASCCQCRICTDLCPRSLLGHPVNPHKFMYAASSGVTNDIKAYLSTFYCSSCGLCELYACGQNLSPRKLMQECKEGLKKNGLAIPKDVKTAPVNELQKYRQVPMERLITHLDLKRYNTDAPITIHMNEPQLVKIKLGQHIGVPAYPIVKEGEWVEQGKKIGEKTENKLSLPVHASITGRVIAVLKDCIWLNKEHAERM